MEARSGEVTVHYVEHGDGQPVLVLHGAGVDHGESEACFEPAFGDARGYRRIYPDLPGMGRTAAPETFRSANDVLHTLLGFADEVCGESPYLLVGHSAGGYYAQAMAAEQPTRVAGLALVCPLLATVRQVPEHRLAVGPGGIGDDAFRSYFVVQTEEMFERFERHVAPGARLTDWAALERIGERWELPIGGGRRTRAPHWWWRDGSTRRSGLPLPVTCSTTTLAAAWRSSTTPGTRCPMNGRHSCAPWWRTGFSVSPGSTETRSAVQHVGALKFSKDDVEEPGRRSTYV